MKKLLLNLGIALLTVVGAQAQQIYVDEDFNAGSLPTGWSTSTISGSDNWQFGFDGSSLEPNINRANNIDSTNFAYFDDDDLGSGQQNNTAALESPSFDNSLAGTTSLRFDYNFRDLSGVSDSLIAQVYDGTNWVTVFSTAGADDCGRYAGTVNPPSGPSGNCNNGFPSANVNISAYANANCQVRFVYHDGNDWCYYAGIDNVTVSAPVDDDIRVAEIVAPLEVACGLDSTYLSIIKIVNEGTARATNFDITIDVDNGTQVVTETVGDTIDGGDSLLFQFSTSVNLAATTSYDLLVYTTWAQDGVNTNDTVRLTVSNEPSFSAPYTDGFETSPSDWKSGGRNSTWAKGFPSGNVISFAPQGNEAWVTNLFGEYNVPNNFEESYIESPCFDFSTALGDPNVKFELFRHSEGRDDSLVLQTSIDNGATWKTVPKTVIERNWYNSQINGKWAWAGRTQGWVTAENILSGLAGEGQVKLRFKFQCDFNNNIYAPGGPFEGFGIDNFRIGFPKAVDLGIQRLLYPTPAGAPECGYSNENIQIRLENRGATDLDTFLVSFQVDNNLIKTDTVYQFFPINTVMNYTFKKTANFTGGTNAPNYRLNVWVTALGDGASSNDSIRNRTIVNTSPNLFGSPYSENFDGNSFTAGTILGNTNSTINPNWVRSAGFSWQVANSGANLPAASGPSSDHTGNNGNFLYTEPLGSAANDVAILETPCLDFSTKDSLILEFYYYGYGGPYGSGLFIDVFDGVEWIEDEINIVSFPQTGSNQAWTLYTASLDKFAGKRIKLRFRFEVINAPSRSVIAIDDLVIYEPIRQDAEIISIDGPISNCALNANSTVEVTVNNFGLDVIPTDSLTLAYQVILGLDTTTVRERVSQSLAQRTQLTYTFITPADLSFPGGNYKILAWTELTGDSNVGNDSITDYEVTNFTRPPGYIESFTSFDFLDGDCLAANLDDVGRGWSAGNSQFTWNLQDARVCRGANGATPTFGTGPNGDHSTSQGDGRFFYTESTLGSQNDEATLTSPCIDFTGRTGASLAFWYHKFGNTMGDLYIDVRADGVWNLGVDTVLGQTQTGIQDDWEVKGVNLSQFADKLIQIRFRGIKDSPGDRGDMAIDDIEFYEPIPQDARVSSVISPVTECSPSSQVTVLVENFGTDSILPNTVIVNYSVDGGGALFDTLGVGIPVSGSVIHNFTVQGVFNNLNTTYNLNAWTRLQGDTNTFNDSVSYQFTNLTQSIQYRENFENFTDGGCAPGGGDVLTRGWSADPIAGGNFHWNVQNAGACGGTGNPTTGPRTDATRGGGQFMYTTSTQGGAIADLYLPCVEFSPYTSAGMTFKYHMFGSQMGTLQVEVYNDTTGQWDSVYSISGQQQTSKFDPWREGYAKFEEFAGNELQIRFRAFKGGSRSEMAIDDVGFYLPQPIDARLKAVVAPVEGCELFEQSIVGVEIENFGTDTILNDSIDVYYQVDNRTPVRETFPDTLFEDEVATYYFTTTTDLSESRRRYNIKAWTSARGEGNVTNDTLFEYVVINETKRTNYFENFETFKDAQCAAPLGQVTQNGWTVGGLNGYTWHVQSSLCREGNKATFTLGTGPEGDHTTGDGIFMYVDGSNNANPEASVDGTAIFLSPCIDLQTNTNVKMSFWYHMFGPHIGSLAVDVFSNGAWDTNQDIIVNGIVDTSLRGQTQTSNKDTWRKAIVDLDAFAGERVLLRFRAESRTGFRGDIGIDDILLYEPSDIDIAVTEIIDPDVDLCQVGTYDVKIRLENLGLSDIDSNLIVTYTNGTSTSTDTITQSIDVGNNLVYTFNTPIDLSLRSGVQDIRVTAFLAGDTILKNNSIRRELNNRQPSLPRYFMDFENHGAGDLQGWRNTPGAGYSWNVQCGSAPWVDGMLPAPPFPNPPTGPSGDHTFSNTLQNGVGCYMKINSDIVPPSPQPDALLELPCGEIDLSNSRSNNILFSFWYHMFGNNTGDLYVDIHDGTTWRNRIDVIRGEQQDDDTRRWRRKQVILDQFAGLPKVKIRFRAEFDTRGGDMAIDDVELLDRVPNDARMVRIIDPASDCELTNTERFRVEFQNTGTDDILETIMAYQLTFTPYKGVPQVQPVVRDTAVGTAGFVAPLAFQKFDFDRIDMSEPGTYTFKIWTEIQGDEYAFNDTIVETVVHETRPFPNCEDFSDMVLGQKPGAYRDGKLPNGWVGTTAPFQFKVGIAGGGPANGHTGRNNDAYILLEDADGMPGQVASLESPCYDLTNTPAAILEFWYQAPSENHYIVIEGRNTGGQYIALDTLRADGGSGGVFQWKKQTIVMTQFVGGFAQLRFTGVNAGDGYFALDDFCMLAPPRQQVEFERFVTPQRGLCFYSNQEVVTMRLENIGLDRITQFQIVLAVDSNSQKFPNGQYLRDTTTITINTNPFFDPGTKVDVRLNLPQFLVDLSARDQFYISAYVLLPGDRDFSNNFIEDYTIFHPTPIKLPFVEDFEFIRGEGIRGNYTNGIQQFVGGSGFYTWTTRVGLNLEKLDLTGPATDHTKGKPDAGVYMVTNSDALFEGDIAVLQTRCIDLSQAVNPEVKYWYHMMDAATGEMGNLYLEINDDSGWRRIDSLLGSDIDQNRGLFIFPFWKSRSISLLPYAGKFVKLRFWSVRGTGQAGDMAIDDLSVIDLAAKDLTPVSFSEPTSDTMSCYTEKQKICVNIRNNGSDSLDFTRDSSLVEVVISKDGIRLDSLTSYITENIWFNENGIAKPLPSDSVANFCLDTTFDMSDTGSVFRFITNLRTNGDVITRNDQYVVSVLSQEVGGEVFRAIPNDTICYGDQVRLRVRNHFGGLRWQEKLSTRSGVDEWFTATNIPFDSSYYIAIPDSTTKYRIRICGSEEYSDSLEVVVIKPFVPTSIDAARCDSGFMTIKAKVQGNITDINVFDSLRNGNRIAQRVVPFGYSKYFSESDTLYLEGVIKTNKVRQGFCVSLQRDTAFATVNVLPDPPMYDTNLVDDCIIPSPVPGQGICIDSLNRIQVCQDSSFVLDGGRVEGRQDNYEWTILKPDGSIINSSNTSADSALLLQNQTLVVDAWLLEKNKVYGYTVIVTSDSGCVNKMPYDTTFVLVSDSCITSIEEVQFKDGFSIYPNPASQELNVKYESVENFKGSIRLLTVEGQVVNVATDLNFSNLNYRIDMGALPKGIYIIKVETEKGSFVEKIIKS